MQKKSTITKRPLSQKQIDKFIGKLKDGTFFGDDKVMVHKAKLLPCLDLKKREIVNYISMHCRVNRKEWLGIIVAYKGRALLFKESDLAFAKQVKRILNTKYK